jgi:hypothetical protein
VFSVQDEAGIVGQSWCGVRDGRCRRSGDDREGAQHLQDLLVDIPQLSAGALGGTGTKCEVIPNHVVDRPFEMDRIEDRRERQVRIYGNDDVNLRSLRRSHARR